MHRCAIAAAPGGIDLSRAHWTCYVWSNSVATHCPHTVATLHPYSIRPSRLPPDAAWVRYSSVCGLLRLARAYDSHMPAALYANLALTLQVGRVEAY